MLDKTGVLTTLTPDKPGIVEIGVGERKRDPEAIGIDILDAPEVDVVGDALEVLKSLPDGSVAQLSSVHVLEHLPYVPELLREVERVLVPGGRMGTTVPHFSNPFYYSDPTHVNFFGLYSFSYYCEDALFRRRVPRYVRQPGLELTSVRLVFKSFPPRYPTHALRKIAQLVFNASDWMKEIYEDSWSRTISCYEIDYEITKRP